MSNASTERRGRTSPDVERLVFFTDAAVAIAMTLLILPLMEGVNEAAAGDEDAFEFLRGNGNALISFVLSFVIVSRFWRSHHRLLQHVDREVPMLFPLNVGWLLTIVFLPVATAMTGAMELARPQYAVYIGTLLAASLLLTAMVVLMRRHPEAWREDDQVPADLVLSSVTVCLLMGLALVVAVAMPAVGYWAMLLLLLSAPVHRGLERLTRRMQPA